jgi:DNA-directed RNA polymerase specialized sigma24 family protein
MSRVRGGDRAAFAELFVRYRDPVWRFFRRRTSDPAQAEELAQDTFAAVLTGAARFEALVSRDFARLRPALDGIVTRLNGFIAHMQVNGARGSSQRLEATLRVPEAQLAAAVAALKQLGTVVDESQAGEDVTAEAVDLDARLSNARETENNAFVQGVSNAAEGALAVSVWVIGITPTLLLLGLASAWPLALAWRRLRAAL